MLAMIATLAFVSFALLTAALVWAVGEVARAADSGREWQPGTNPHACRF
jgi:hypothetical protein